MHFTVLPFLLFLSPQATLLEFEFDGELLAPRGVSSGVVRGYIDQQLLYTIGHLNADNSVARLDKVTLTNVRVTPQQGSARVRFHATLPVAWGSKTQLPTSYVFTLPRGMEETSIHAFSEKYKARCVDFAAHEVDAGSMWYYYRPSRSGCTLDESDVVRTTATVSVSPENTTAKYPEMERVWEDGALNVVAIFGKFEDGATSSVDAGIAAFNTFTRGVKSELAPFSLVTTPASVPTNPGVAAPDITFTATLAEGRKVTVTALLIDQVLHTGPVFDARYEELSTRADLIAYNGHAGLGAIVRALASKGRFVAKQYVIVFLNGSDSFAYVGGELAQVHALVNPDDPRGTKYLEIVSNGMPAFFSSMAQGTLALLRGLMKVDAPPTYDQMVANVDRWQVVNVTGEEDNAYDPGDGDGPWTGLDVSSTVSKSAEERYSTPTLPAGHYVFRMTGTGDADLYVRRGAPPTTRVWDCRPYKSGTSEQCEVHMTAPERLHVMVRGYAATSTYRIVGEAQ